MGKLSVTEEPKILEKVFAYVDTAQFTSWNSHPLFGQFGRELYSAVNKENGRHIPSHFAVMDGDEPLLLGPATHSNEDVSSFGLPLTLGIREGLSKKLQKKTFAATFEHLQKIAKRNNVAIIKILGSYNNSTLGPSDIACINHRAHPQTHIHAIVEDAQDAAAIHRQLRDSYRSLVNWGRRKLQTVYVNANSPSRKQFDAYQTFHAKVTGRVRYGSDYWNVFWQEIIAGRGELSLGYLDDGTLATGTLVIDAADTTYYASGVYDRNLFDKPLGHYPVFDSIVRSNTRGIKTYDLGEIFSAGKASDKEMQIGFFKKGFTSSFRLRTTWIVSVS